MTDRLLHYADADISGETLKDIDNTGRINAKPLGLWVSPDTPDGWAAWCIDNDFRLPSLAFTHEVALKPDASILRIDSHYALDVFTRRHSVHGTPGHPRCQIDWGLVAENYDGVLIAPHQWSMEMMTSDLDWYYGWDCASGCIWRPSRAIASVEMVAQTLKERRQA